MLRDQRASELGSPAKPPVDIVHDADVDSEGEALEPASSWQSFGTTLLQRRCQMCDAMRP